MICTESLRHIRQSLYLENLWTTMTSHDDVIITYLHTHIVSETVGTNVRVLTCLVINLTVIFTN